MTDSRVHLNNISIIRNNRANESHLDGSFNPQLSLRRPDMNVAGIYTYKRSYGSGRCDIKLSNRILARNIRILEDFDKWFQSLGVLRYETTKWHSHREHGRSRNSKRSKRERYDLPRITCHQFGLSPVHGAVAVSESLERDS